MNHVFKKWRFLAEVRKQDAMKMNNTISASFQISVINRIAENWRTTDINLLNWVLHKRNAENTKVVFGVCVCL